MSFAKSTDVKNSDRNILDKNVKYTGAEAKRDPFSLPPQVFKLLEAPPKQLLPEEVKVVLPKVELQGIIFKKNNPQAIVNGNVISVGQYIEEFEIRKISKTGIILFYKGQEYEIRMQN